jgi:hypothetical protein
MTRPRNGLADRIAKPALAQPGSPFARTAGDILISRTAPDGSVRRKEDALEVARRRDVGAAYKGSDARWFVFAVGGRR